MGTIVEANERPGRDVPMPPLEVVQEQVMRFLREEAGFAQVFTVNARGFPVGRTMGAPIDDDWSVILIQRGVHRRLAQLRRNPRVEIVWVGSPAPENVNDRPHVYDFGLNAPRVVFLRGIAEPLSPDETVRLYRRQTAVQVGRGLTRAPERTDENVRTELVGLRVRPLQVRAEGFAGGAQSITWTVARDVST